MYTYDEDSHNFFLFDKRGYRCKEKKCKGTSSLKQGSKFYPMKIKFKKILRGFYCWAYSYTNYQAVNMCQVSEGTYIEIKNMIMDVFAETQAKVELIPGTGIRFNL